MKNLLFLYKIFHKTKKDILFSSLGSSLHNICISISFYFSVIGAGSVNLERIYYSLPTIIVLAVIIPLLTMRSFSEERKSGTEQLLLTSPLSITKIVLGKFIAATVVVVITELISFMYFAITSHFGAPHMQTALVTMFGFLLFCMISSHYHQLYLRYINHL